MKVIFLALVAITLCAANLVAQSPPIITSQPTNQTVLAGSNAMFNVAVSGTGPFTYQWQFNGTNLPTTNIVAMVVAGNGNTSGYSGDGGAATNARLYNPFGVATDASGNLFIADAGNSRIRKVDTNGIISTVAGSGSLAGGYSGDGGAATNARLYYPMGMAVDGSGNLFIADEFNNRIRKVDTNGTITTVAGADNYGYAGDGGSATNAKLWYPYGVTVDIHGNLFIADEGNNRIRKVDTNGIITTVAGTNTSGYSGDGGSATNAKLNGPYSVAVDAFDNLLIADFYNFRVRKVDTNGIITTVAGTGNYGYTGDGGSATNAKLSFPSSVFVDSYGYLFIADYVQGSSLHIRQVDSHGIISTMGGTFSTGGPSGGGVTVDTLGNLYFADNGRSWIYKVTMGRYPSLRSNNVTTNAAGNYDVIITSPYGSVTSSVVSLTVVFPPSIVAQPQSVLVTNGTPASFSVSADGTPPFSFQWQKNGTNLMDGGNISGSATNDLILSTTTTNDTGYYAVIITNAYGGVTSSTVTLKVAVPPCITLQPTNQIVLNGSNVVFNAAVSGTGPFAYQWQFNGTNLPDNTIITTVAGNGTNGYSGDGGAATNAKISSPKSVAVDASGNLFIADYGNNRVRKVDTNGIITTVAGTGSYTSSGDGGVATNAGFNYIAAVAVDVSNNLFIADMDAGRIRKVDTNGIITTVAGKGFGYSGDGGAATNASMSFIEGVAVDTSGNLFIADYGNFRTRKVNTSGIISTLASVASVGVAVDTADNVFIANGGTLVYKVDTNGIMTTVAGGNYGFSGDGGAATNASLNSPNGVTVDIFGNLFVADYNNNRIRKVSPNGIITTVAGKGDGSYYGDGGVATNASLFRPNGVAVDAAGNLFIADESNRRIRKVNLAGSPALTLNNVTPNRALLSYSPPSNSVFLTLNGSGATNAGNFSVIITSPYGSVTSSIATLTVVFPPSITDQPYNVTVINGGSANFSLTTTGTGPIGYQWYFNANTAIDGGTNATLPIANAGSGQVGSYFCVITNAYGTVTSRVVALSLGVPPAISLQPTNQTLLSGSDGTFNVAVSGTGPFTYQWQFNGTNIPNNIITTVAGNGTNGFSGDGGAATNACLKSPNSAAADAFGNLFIVDRGNYRIRKADTNGIITTVAGNGSPFYSGDGGSATNAGLYAPVGMDVDVFGNLFIADVNERRIRKVDANGIIATVAGNGISSYSGDGGPATNASLRAPTDVVVDVFGNLFIADESNNRIRKVDINGIITTVAGNGAMGYSGDGGAATNASLTPEAVAVDGSGNLFIADVGNHRIRKVGTNGIITTVAGNGTNGFSGDGGAATNASLSSPVGVTVDGSGNLFISDTATNRVRQVDTNGIITTVAGDGNYGYSGDGGAATNASLRSPQRIAVDGSGNLFIAEQQNHCIRKVALGGSPALTLSGVATTNAGNYSVVITSPYGSVTSSIVTLTVLVPPSISGLVPNLDGSLTLNFTGGARQTYLLQAATNLTLPIIWQTLSTNVAETDGTWQFTDMNASNYPARFYRSFMP